jgi:hypothetical protein
MSHHETYDPAQEAAMVDAYMNANGLEAAHAMTAPASPAASPAPDGGLDPGDDAKVDAYMRYHYPAG